MSFSSLTKDEIVKLRLRGRTEKLSVLCAMTHTAGAMTLGRGIGVQYVSENHNVAKLIASLASSLYDVQASIAVREQEGLKARNTLVQLSGEGCRALLADAGCLPGDAPLQMGHIPEVYTQDEKVMRCFLRGAFLGAGSITNPRKGYHMEIVCRHDVFAAELCALLNQYGLNARIAARKTSYLAYIKEGDKVADFLRILGASNSTMEFEHARIVRNLSNNLNRQRNFEDANMQKTARSCAQQLIDIAYIRDHAGLESLPNRLYVLAEARLNAPEASLAELSELLEVSKSGVNHRFARIAERAAALRAQNGEV